LSAAATLQSDIANKQFRIEAVLVNFITSNLGLSVHGS